MYLDSSSLLDMFVLTCSICMCLVIVDVAALVSTLAGSGAASWADGIGTASSFNYPHGIAVSSDGIVFVADTDNHRIRMVSTSGEGLSMEALHL